MLGLIQLIIVLFIKKQTEDHGGIDRKDLTTILQSKYSIGSSEQILVTINRLVDRGLIAYNEQTQLAFINHPKSAQIIEKATNRCHQALSLI